MLTDKELIAVASEVATLIKQPQYGVKPLAPKQKRVVKKLKIKPRIYDLAKAIYLKNYPFAEEPDFDALIEQLITLGAYQLGLVDEKIEPQTFKKKVIPDEVAATKPQSEPITPPNGDVVDEHLSLLN